MFVLTVDQKGSRSDEDRVPHALLLLADIPTLAPFERTVGDEFQGVLTSPSDVYEAVMRLMRDGRWHCGIGVGQGSFPHPTHPRSVEGRGLAFIAARQAVEDAKDLTPSVSLHLGVTPEKERREPGQNCSAENRACAQALVRLAASIVAHRTPRQWEVLDVVRTSSTLAQAGQTLGISTSAVSQSLSASQASLEMEAYEALVPLLQNLNSCSEQEAE